MCLGNTMKRMCLLLVLPLFMAACQKEDFNPNTFPQTWKLHSYSTMIPNSWSTDLFFQEVIILNSSGEFRKERTHDGVTQIAEGTYRFEEDSPRALILEHAQQNELIDNCGSGLLEYFVVSSESSMNGGSAPCDGPMLYYNRVD